MKRKELTESDIYDDFYDIYDDLKLKKNLWTPWFIQKYFNVVMVKMKHKIIMCQLP